MTLNYLQSPDLKAKLTSTACYRSGGIRCPYRAPVLPRRNTRAQKCDRSARTWSWSPVRYMPWKIRP